MEPQTANKTWDLSLYELHRKPQEIITDNTEIAVSPRSLHSELMWVAFLRGILMEKSIHPASQTKPYEHKLPISLLGVQFASTCLKRRWQQRSVCTDSAATASSRHFAVATKNVQHVERNSCQSVRCALIPTLTTWYRWVQQDTINLITVNHNNPPTRRKFTPVATNTKRIRRKFSPNSTKATHSKPSSTPSRKASSFNLRIVHRESAKAKRIRAMLSTGKQRAIHRPTAKASRHVNHRIHRQLAVHLRPFHRTQAPPARLQRSAHAPSWQHPKSPNSPKTRRAQVKSKAKQKTQTLKLKTAPMATMKSSWSLSHIRMRWDPTMLWLRRLRITRCAI